METEAALGGRATRAIIDRDAIAFNARALVRHALPAELMAVVKANGYGHGAVEVARAALRGGATRIGVYAPQEGAELRRAGIDAPILIFGGFEPAEIPAILSLTLTPTVHSIGAAERLSAAATRETNIHVKVDTGLNRAGVDAGDVAEFVHAVSALPHLRVEGLYTHFARADECDKTATLEQLTLFLKTVRVLSEAGARPPLVHAANTAATLDVPESHLSIVRCGIGLYGYYPSDDVARSVDLRPALTLRSVVSRVHTITSGTGVGYGHEFVAQRETAVALVPIGYGDGLPRSLGNGRGRILIRGRSAPTIGRVSMDQITVDVTDIEGVGVGDEAVLIGEHHDVRQTAEDLALQAGTISYDILTGLLPRVPRVYR